MKQGIHPEYHKVIFLDTTTNFKFLSGSTKTSSETMEWEDGNEYPVLLIHIHSILAVKNSLLRMVVWNASTKSLVSNQTTTNFEFQLSTYPLLWDCRQFFYFGYFRYNK